MLLFSIEKKVVLLVCTFNFILDLTYHLVFNILSWILFVVCSEINKHNFSRETVTNCPQAERKYLQHNSRGSKQRNVGYKISFFVSYIRVINSMRIKNR